LYYSTLGFNRSLQQSNQYNGSEGSWAKKNPAH
jgi:hypothetical protein